MTAVTLGYRPALDGMRALAVLSVMATHTGIRSSTALRIGLFFAGSTPERLYYAIDTRADGLLLECVLGILFVFDRLPIAKLDGVRFPVALAAVAVVASPMLVSLWRDPYMLVAGYLLAALISGGLIIAVVSRQYPLLLRVLERREPVWVGRISYSLYCGTTS